MKLCERVRNALSVVLVAAALALHVGHLNFLRLGLRVLFSRPRKLLKMSLSVCVSLVSFA